MADVLVIGGGIAGLTLALALDERSAEVHLVDAEMPGAASRASAGLLAPSLEGLPGFMRGVAIAARDAYPPLLESLRERTGVDVALDRGGILELATSEGELAGLGVRAGGMAELLDAATLARMEPAFAGHPGAVFHPDDGAVDNVALMLALDAAARRAGIRRSDDAVASLDLSRHPPTALTRSGAHLSAGQIVLAAGAWVSTLSALPRPLPVRPIRGQLVRLDARPIRHVTYGAGGYLIPRGKSLLVGATSEKRGLRSGVTGAGLASLRDIARRAIPALKSSPVLDHWAGLRPMTPDGLPILGVDPEFPSLAYACGYSRNGILLAPYLAHFVASAISGGPPPEVLGHFSASRFGGNVTIK